MDKKCPICGDSYRISRTLTRGTHKHITNAVNKDVNSYCINYTTDVGTNGASVKAKAYFHKKDFNEGGQE